YNVSGYGNPDFFWEETRWVDTTYKTQYRTRRIELPLTLQVTLMLYDQNSIDTKLICTEGQPYGELPNPARDGYTFDGWYTLEIGGDRITASSIFGKESAQILFAHWTPVPPKIYTVSFDTNGGYGDTTSIYVIENETYGALPTPVRTDYSFDGWFTSSVGGSLITSSTPVNLSGPQTLYAHWTKDPVKTFTVSFDSVGGTVNTSSIKVTNGETYGTLPLPQKQGYTFNGWYTSESVQILSSTVVNLSGNQTLYAHWTRIPVKSFTVSFNPEGGTVSTSSITVTNGEAYGTMPLPQKQGYAFNGWYTNDSVQILSSTIVNLSGNQTLYAHWTKNETTMNFVDVSPYNYFYDAVSWAVENHVTKGTTNTTFSPHATCTKAHIITFLWRAFGSPEPTINKTFVDVDDGKYYAKATVWAYEKGLVSGDTFGGGNLCTRASAVLFLWQIAGSPEAEEYTFDDVLQDAKYADAVSWAVSEGITNGTTKTTFDPHQICSRGHIVTFLWRYFVQ
ncbi:MAG: InlB B-repeat-containing protein, partial [Oscillibacter sp.]|nr:InlB B-repeat-containing protein [Oscillibacter sp.]